MNYMISRFAVDVKFSIYIHIHIHRFSVDIHGYIHIHRRLSRVPHVASILWQNTTVQKRPFFAPPLKNITQTFLSELLKN